MGPDTRSTRPVKEPRAVPGAGRAATAAAASSVLGSLTWPSLGWGLHRLPTLGRRRQPFPTNIGRPPWCAHDADAPIPVAPGGPGGELRPPGSAAAPRRGL